MNSAEFESYTCVQTAALFLSPSGEQRQALLRAVLYSQRSAEKKAEATAAQSLTRKLEAYEDLCWLVRKRIDEDSSALEDEPLPPLGVADAMQQAVEKHLPAALQPVAAHFMPPFFTFLDKQETTREGIKTAEILIVASARSAFVVAVDVDNQQCSFRHFEMLPAFWKLSLRLTEVDEYLEDYVKPL